jgi:hypothetical protein
MSTSLELDCQRKRARSFYLELHALGLEVWRVDDEALSSVYRLVLIGTESLSPRHGDRLRRRVEELKAGLKTILSSNWQVDLLAIKGEGTT